jgi:hypothetical protein
MSDPQIGVTSGPSPLFRDLCRTSRLLAADQNRITDRMCGHQSCNAAIRVLYKTLTNTWTAFYTPIRIPIRNEASPESRDVATAESWIVGSTHSITWTTTERPGT